MIFRLESSCTQGRETLLEVAKYDLYAKEVLRLTTNIKGSLLCDSKIYVRVEGVMSCAQFEHISPNELGELHTIGVKSFPVVKR